MSSSSWGLVVQVILSFLGPSALFGLLMLRGQKDKLKADTRSTDTTADVSLSEEVREWNKQLRADFKEDMEHLEAKVENAERKADRASSEVRFLRNWIRAQGMNPPEFVYDERRTG
jgi:hypothetical protein